MIIRDKQVEVARMNNFEELVAERVILSIDPADKICEKEVVVKEIIVEPKKYNVEVPMVK